VHFEHSVALIAGYPASEVIKGAVLGAFCALIGYLLSERYKHVRGVTPWRVPSGAWAAILFFSNVFGFAVYAIACASTKPQPGLTGWRAGDQRPDQQPQNFQVRPPEGWNAPPPGQWGSGTGQGWEPPSVGTGVPGAGDTAAAPPFLPPVAAPAPPPRSWIADPSGHHELRYWDGTKFTEHVADGGKITVDPL
jgi:hypothetical protein